MNDLQRDIRSTLGDAFFANARITLNRDILHTLDCYEPIKFNTPFKIPLESIDINHLTLLAQECHDMFWGDPKAIVHVINDIVMDDMNTCYGDMYRFRMLNILNLDSLLLPILPRPWYLTCIENMAHYNNLKHDLVYDTYIVGVLQRV